MKYIKQHDERDCGAACLAMISDYWGLKYPIQKFRNITKTDRNGTNLYGLVDGAEKIGFKAEGLDGSVNDLITGIKSKEINFPFVAHIITEHGFEHYIVVAGIYHNGFKIIDPASGKKKITFQAFSDIFTGHICTFEVTEKFNKGNYIKGSFIKFFSFLRGQYFKLFNIIFLSTLISVIGIVGSYVFQIVLDDFVYKNDKIVCDDDCKEDHEHNYEDANNTENNDIFDTIFEFVEDHADKFNVMFISLIGLYILQAIMHYSRGWLIAKMSKKVDTDLISSYVEHIVDMPLKDVNTRNTGEYLSRFGDTSKIREAISEATITLLMDSLMVFFCGIILFNENQVLFYISLIMIVIYAIIVAVFRKPIRHINQDIMENNAYVQSYLKEAVAGIETIQAKNAQINVKKKFRQKCDKFIMKVYHGNIMYISQDTFTLLAESIGTIIILWVGFGMVLNKSVTAGSIITFYTLLSFFIEPIKNLIELQPMLQTAAVAAERLNDVLDTPAEDLKGTPVPDKCDINIDNVSFRYGNRDLVINNLSMSIHKGEKIAIVGESGCGKTTIAKLLMGFYECESGTIKIGEKLISDISKSELRSKTAYVSQNTFLFSGLIKDNIKLGNEDLTDKQIEKICEISSADEFIDTLPQGYNSILDENANNFSGGQKQRLAIACSLTNNPSIIILDEATSNLDPSTESSVINSIFSNYNEATIILIAHRLNTVKSCDCIYVMDNGNIIEAGKHNELIEKKGKYYELITASLSV